MENKTKHKIKTLLADFVIAILGLSYIFYRMLTLESRNLSPIDMLVDGLFAIVVGVAIKQTYSEKGIIKGYETDEYKTEDEKHNNACNDSIEFIEYYDEYEEETIQERKKKYRLSQLQSARLKYNDFFESDGEIKDVVIHNYDKKHPINKADLKPYEFVLDKYQRKVLNRCYKVKINVLNLFSEYRKNNDNFSDKETTDKQQREKTLSKNILSAIAFTLAGLYFAPKLVEFDLGAIIMASVQVMGFIATGIAQMFENINYIKVDKVNILKEKTKRLSIFINNCRNGKYQKKEEERKPLVNENLVEETHC